VPEVVEDDGGESGPHQERCGGPMVRLGGVGRLLAKGVGNC
jgi:hypothetical protein